jgi:hypothetical protein
VPKPKSKKLPTTASTPMGIADMEFAAALEGPDSMTRIAAAGTTG